MKRKNAMILVIIWLLVMVSIIASLAVLLLSGKSLENTRWVSSQDAQMLERYARLDEIRRTLQDNYYLEVSDDELMEGAIRGMFAALDDPYSFYYSAEEMNRHMEEVQGEYKGIGLLIENNADGYIEVLRVYQDGPAYASGAQVGDLIVAVDGKTVFGTSKQNLNDALALMRGKDGSSVVLTVRRGEDEVVLNIVRGDVNISNVSSAVLEDDIGYINIFQFSGDASEGFETALNELVSGGAKGLIIDVRNNPGGVLDDVVHIADLLLPKGTIVYTEDRAGGRRDYYSDENCCELPVVVLINEMSASASEILAAAVQDMNRGTIVGMQSYGKGVVQTLFTFEADGAGMQYTSACYFTSSGKNINGKGVVPDILAEETNGRVSMSGIPEPETDSQLQEAIKALKEMM